MRLRTRLILITLVPVLVLVTYQTLTYQSIVSKMFESSEEMNRMLTETSASIQVRFTSIRGLVEEWRAMVSATSGDQQTALRALEAVEGYHAERKATISNLMEGKMGEDLNGAGEFEDYEELQEANGIAENYFIAFRNEVVYFENNRNSSALQESLRRLEGAEEQSIFLTQKLIDFHNSEITSEEETRGKLETTALLNLYVVAFTTLFALLISFGFLDSMVSRPFKQISESIDEITRGNFEVELEKSNITEFREVQEALERVLASLKLAIARKRLESQEVSSSLTKPALGTGISTASETPVGAESVKPGKGKSTGNKGKKAGSQRK
jgi:methyl-accepting chemotaxis protein